MNRTAQSGFTLIELLVVVAIIGVLAAIAMPQFAAYRARAFNARVEMDIHTAATSQEAYYIDNDTYATGACTTLPGFTGGDGVVCNTTGTATSFTVNASHPLDSYGTGCTWDSTANPAMSCS
jgi:prepilin-type N-terminal cleavage/methylation domain-containing protein